jgi:hypothetical protein
MGFATPEKIPHALFFLQEFYDITLFIYSSVHSIIKDSECQVFGSYHNPYLYLHLFGRNYKRARFETKKARIDKKLSPARHILEYTK